MFCLIYSSIAVKTFTPTELEEMLVNFRFSNKDLDITGALLYDGGVKIMQAIEGPEHRIQALFSKIEQDSRHHSVKVLSMCQITERNFGLWTMHYKEFSPSKSTSEGDNNIFTELFGDMPLLDFDPTVRLAQNFRRQFD